MVSTNFVFFFISSYFIFTRNASNISLALVLSNITVRVYEFFKESKAIDFFETRSDNDLLCFAAQLGQQFFSHANH